MPKLGQSIAAVTGHSAETSLITSRPGVLKERLSPSLFSCLKNTTLNVLKTIGSVHTAETPGALANAKLLLIIHVINGAGGSRRGRRDWAARKMPLETSGKKRHEKLTFAKQTGMPSTIFITD